MEDRAWDDRDTARYLASHSDAVVLFPIGRSQPTLDFLRELPGLRAVHVEGPVRDDSAAFDVTELESLCLLTRSKKPLRLAGLSQLRDLAVHHRDGLEGIRELERLRELTVVRWIGVDLRFVGNKPKLRFLRLEGRKHRARLDGIEGCPDLDELMVLDVCVESIEPLKDLVRLRQVQLTGVRGETTTEPWDLSVLVKMRQLEWFRAPWNGPVRSLAPLRRLPSLRGVAVGLGAEILDGDLSVLVDLPPQVVVGDVDDRPHYSHTNAEITRLRA